MAQLETDSKSSDKTTQAESKRVSPFEFRGDGTEYFKIWIVNIFLTLITLGIYSAWATVRNNRYFYGNTFVDGTSFSYLAKPLQILKGRIIAVVVFALFVGLAGAFPVAGAILYLVLGFAAPYIYNQSLAFKMRNTSYRNIQFRFNGDYGEAFGVLVIWPFLGLISLGLLYPLVLLKIQQYRTNQTAYGTTQFVFSAQSKDYYKIFGNGVGISLGLVVSFWILIWFMTSIISSPLVVTNIATLVAIGSLMFVVTYFTVAFTNLVFINTTLKEHGFNATLTLKGYAKVILINILLIVITLGLYLPAAKVRIMKYITSCIELHERGSLDDFIAAEKESVSALGEQLGDVFDFSV
jgi:uncharacterized membrane protein YjgN (DUF898 family)